MFKATTPETHLMTQLADTQELSEQLQKLIGERLPQEADMPAFTRGLYSGLTAVDLVQERPDHLYAAAVNLYRFVFRRASGEVKVRVFNPRLDEHGYATPHTVVEIVQPDTPFLVDSVSAELSRVGADIQVILHPIFKVERNIDGKVVQLDVAPSLAPTDAARLESVLHLRVRAQPAEKFGEIEQRLRGVLRDVHVAIQDYPLMRERCAALATSLESTQESSAVDVTRSESGEFLRWMSQREFVFLGYQRLQRKGTGETSYVRGEGLGLLRDPSRDVFDWTRVPSDLRGTVVFKSTVPSTVHRAVPFDVVVTCLPSGEALEAFVGLFSLSAYSRSPSEIPLLRQKLKRVVDSSGFLPESYDAKTLRYILETYPRDELFQIDEATLLRIGQGILRIQHRQRVALFTRKDAVGRFVSCLVYVPRDRMDTTLRLKVQDILCRAYGGELASYSTSLGNEPHAKLHFIINTADPSKTPIHQEIEAQIEKVTQGWEDRLLGALVAEFGEQVGSARARQFAQAFPASYREAYDELAAVSDVALAVDAATSGVPRMKLFRPVEFGEHQLRLKVFIPSGIAALSDIVPMLENMGLRVVSEVPFEIRASGGLKGVRLQDFTVSTEGDVPVDLALVRAPFIAVFGAVWSGAMADDGFNKLIIHAHLQGRDVKVLRTYALYLRQVRSPFSLHYMEATLRRYPDFTRTLVQVFYTKFDPAWLSTPAAIAGTSVPARPSVRGLSPEDEVISQRQTIADELIKKARSMLDAVDNLDDDRILRAFLSVLDATVRTNFFQLDASGHQKDYVALKFDCMRIENLPKPRPLREIFVFSPRVEGVHLRFGLVARGGLRWSDRLEDFRTEVLGLVKAQQVKNAVIVPVGSKGGFVVQKAPPPEAGRDAQLQEGIACYRIFVSGLLDVTDNRVQGKVTRPESVIAHDGDDPYLVVAADKGTATFSDIANEISVSRGFWLGDAFASGGSAGYDHKVMGITARGAWESVKRHFREMGKDIQTTPFTCCGVGDMSGDVFGNGMLQSKQLQLVAAFNHQHIFLDPTPDAARSWQERERMFRLPRSTWADYDPSLISKGGGVFERKSKRIALSLEIKALLGINDDSLSPNDLIVAILRCKVELLFFGGIGTYVKGRAESHAEVGDRSNDLLRVNASELGAAVIGEGANLAMTQDARVEFALAGGRCNTDFIDNSAGVDCSDHEVNIKILLGQIESGGEMTRKQRNVLLADMTEDVAGLVLRDNYLQSQAITVSQGVGVRLTDRLGRYIRALEKRGVMDRKLEHLPDDEGLVERVRRGLGFTRPELSTLLSYSKNVLYSDLLQSSLPDDPALEPFLIDYFPDVLQARYPEAIRLHQLRREISATVLTNELINRMGITFVHEACEMTGVGAAAVAGAYLVAREVLNMPALWRAIEDLDGVVHGSVQASMLADCGRSQNNFVVWLVRTHGSNATVDGLVRTYKEPFQELVASLHELVSQTEREEADVKAKDRITQGVPTTLAMTIALLPLFAALGDIVQLSFDTHRAVGETARVYFRVGEKFGVTWLRGLARRLPTERAWDRQAVAAVLNDLHATQRELVGVILSSSAANVAPQLVIDAWCAKRQALVDRNTQLVAELQSAMAPNFAMLAVANGHLKSLLLDAQKSVTLVPPPAAQRRKPG
jgi:glutamate dehydrogenase